MTQKIYLNAQQLLEDSFYLGMQVLDSGFKPTVIVALWRGGVPIGIAVQELLAFHGIESNHMAIRTSSYKNADDRSNTVQIMGVEQLAKSVNADERLLIIDDVFDTGKTIAAVIDCLGEIKTSDMPLEVRVAVPYFKPSKNLTARVPDYYLHETEAWLVYPHSIEGLTEQELAENRPQLYDIIKDEL